MGSRWAIRFTPSPSFGRAAEPRHNRCMQKPRDAVGVAGSCFAEARISYGGRGQITDVQQARYGQQILNIIAPF